MDQAIRNKLRNVVTQCRKLLEEATSRELQGKFGIYAAKKDDVQIDDEARLSHLTEADRAARRDILDHFEHIQARGFKAREAVEQLVREVAFTHLNRLCAYKMMEAREVYVGGQKFREAVSRGVNSNGVMFYLADHPEDEQLFKTGQQELAYRHFLDWLGGQLSEEIGVLFSPHDPANRLYPPQRVLDQVIDLLNGGDIKPEETELRKAWPEIWSQDETIGWVYQYFTPKELRDQARKESQAPRNSYELAFRNQFFTPRYVVEFLTDNTLGRIWYEMRKGDTKLEDRCRYMVRRPSEVFLAEGRTPPEPRQTGDELSQEDLLKQPVYVPHRSKKDPRELSILDPACGSGHFLLYCFDLLLTIYEEAYADPDLGPKLKLDYPTLDVLLRDMPRLILAHNLYGIDIDLRATQIAALALWLRCQRAYREMGLKKERPEITRSNIVCAEPMPGEEGLLDEFLGTLAHGRLELLVRRVLRVPDRTRVKATEEMAERLGNLVRLVWAKMKLAGEAGSLLKIEEELQEAIRIGQEEWEEKQPLFSITEYGLTDQPKPHFYQRINDPANSFWQQAEGLVLAALQDFAAYAGNGKRFKRQLFVDDALQGFAFLDLCRRRFDVVLMNPPFGDSSKPAKTFVDKEYPRTKNDMYAAFIEKAINRLYRGALLGAISSRTGFFLSSFQKWREEILLAEAQPTVFVDLGYGVLDTAMVETACYCLEAGSAERRTTFIRLLDIGEKPVALEKAIHGIKMSRAGPNVFDVSPKSFEQVPGSPFAYWVSDSLRRMFQELPRFESNGRTVRQGLATADDFRFIRCWWEAPAETLLDAANGPNWRADIRGFQQWCRQRTDYGKRWVPIAKGGVFSPFYDDLLMVVNWEQDGAELKAWADPLYGDSGWSRIIKSVDFYFRPGLTWPLRGIRLSAQAVPAGACFSVAGKLATSNNSVELFPLLGLMNSLPFDSCLRLSAGETRAQFEVGLIGKVPLPKTVHDDMLVLVSEKATRAAAFPSTFDECRHVFVVPQLIAAEGFTLLERMGSHNSKAAATKADLVERQLELDDLAFTLYGIGSDDRETMEKRFLCARSESVEEPNSDDEAQASPVTETASGVDSARELLSYGVGCVCGRWDVRFAIGEQSRPQLPDPFDPLPVCPPGMLQGADGLPLLSAPPLYPLRIDWDGVLVDDPDHADDIVRRVREVLEVIWEDRADAIEKEACAILGVQSLREYFRRPGKAGFLDDHVSRYSKSRRKAPIYWLLQSSRKNYALWLYYHRLDKDLLFKALVNYVEPKIRLEESRLAALRGQKAGAGESGKAAKKVENQIEKQEEFVSELRDFEDKLRRAANRHLEPDLNDGVVLNIAPLHELVPWKEAKKYWQELLEGKYEWSSIGKQLREKGVVKAEG